MSIKLANIGPWRNCVILLFVAITLAGLPAQSQENIEVGQEIFMAKNLSGEICRLRFAGKIGDTGGVRYTLLCDGWNQPSAEIRRLPGGEKFDLYQASGEDGHFKGRLAECSKPADLDGTVFRACSHRDGGWPQVSYASRSGHSAFVAVGLPTTIELLRRAIDQLDGRKNDAASPTDRLSLVRFFEETTRSSASLVQASDVSQLVSLRRVGQELNYARRYNAAQAAIDRALALQARLLGADHWSLGDLMTIQARNLLGLSRLEEALELADRAEPYVLLAHNPNHRPYLLATRGAILRGLGRLEDSLASSNSAVEAAMLFSKAGAALGFAEFERSTTLRALGRYSDSVVAAEDAVRNYTAAYGWPHPMIAWAWRNVMLASSLAGNVQSTRKSADKSTSMLRQLYGETFTFGLAKLYEGDALRSIDPTGALQAYREGAAVIERDKLIDDRVPDTVLNNFVGTLIAASPELQEKREILLGEAFRAAQLGSDPKVAGSIKAMSLRLQAGDPAMGSAVREFQDARIEAQAKRAALSRIIAASNKSGKSRTSEESAQRELESAIVRQERAEHNLQAGFPQYVGLSGLTVVEWKQIAATLSADEAFVSIFVRDSSLDVFLIRLEGISAHRVYVSKNQIAETVSILRAEVTPGREPPKKFNGRLAHELYLQLLGPYESELAKIRRLIVAANGPLASIPFSLLLTSPPDGTTPSHSWPWLVKRHATTIVPSIGSFIDLRRSTPVSRAQQPFIGFANPDYRAAAHANEGIVDCGGIPLRQKVAELAPLPETVAEIRSLASALSAASASVISGKQASKRALKDLMLDQFRVVAFATHGLLAGEISCVNEPSLALTPGDGSAESGLLTMSDIIELKLNADWVILSACNTAGPDGSLHGEQLSGLAHAFFYAGARGLLVSHWQVYSKPTVALTTRTVSAYAKSAGESKAIPLQLAQLELMKNPETAHPVFWAAFVLVSDGR